jgi:hypothetical membrane protein
MDIIAIALSWLLNHTIGFALVLLGITLVWWFKFSVAGLVGLALVAVGAAVIIFSFL